MSGRPGEKNHRLAALALAGAAALALAARRAWSLDPHLVRTASGPALVYTTRDAVGARVRVLRTGGVYQSATYLDEARRMEPVFAYYRAFARALELRPGARRVLAVGGGGFAFPKLVAAEHPGVRTDVAEIDPAVIRAARRWFFLDDAVALARAGGGDLRVFSDDGRAFLERAPEASYDVIALDAFVGAEPVWALATVGALRAARRALVPGGVLAANVVSRDGGADVSFLRSVVATARVVFSHVEVFPATDDSHAAEDNYLVVASDGSLCLSDAIGYDADFLGEVLLDE
ncbi:spermidine synthase [Olsenella profusa]|uniref:Fused MFS/spermidine synthase n=1 Tax=Olsenella profusa TaxID=138595 RepID=A0ABS2F3H4_9ACTN|nr:fused MFS/spermidine synthase [Olsenella profusa]MBM6775554.1 fused MFS/spermidine synthase [Olsenella profusa]